MQGLASAHAGIQIGNKLPIVETQGLASAHVGIQIGIKLPIVETQGLASAHVDVNVVKKQSNTPAKPEVQKNQCSNFQ